LYFCCLFAFIAGSPFVYIEYFGVRPQYYGFLFGVNVLGMIASTFVNSRIVVQRGGDRLLRIACVIGAAGGLILLATGVMVLEVLWVSHFRCSWCCRFLPSLPPTRFPVLFLSSRTELARRRLWPARFSSVPELS
jgi:hypothetical protein